MIRIAFIVTGLGTGGAERMLLKLLQQMDRNRFTPLVVSLRDRGDFGADIEALGIELLCLGLPRPAGLLRLKKVMRRLREFSPQLVQGWMYHGNLFASHFARRLPGRPPALWSIRQTLLSLKNEGRMTRAIIRRGARWSRTIHSIIYNSEQSIEQHAAIGYTSNNAVLIPNGFELDIFKPDSKARAEFRSRLHIPMDSLVVGMVARVHPMKDHTTFLAAAQHLHARMPDVIFLLVGLGTDSDEIREQIAAAGLTQSFRLAGRQSDLAAIYPAMDLAVLTSRWGEGFPNVLGEAMACGLPCVATDVGACAYVVASPEQVVAIGDVESMANRWQAMLTMPAEQRAALGQRNRERVMNNFSMLSVSQRYAEVWQDVAMAMVES